MKKAWLLAMLAGGVMVIAGGCWAEVGAGVDDPVVCESTAAGSGCCSATADKAACPKAAEKSACPKSAAPTACPMKAGEAAAPATK